MTLGEGDLTRNGDHVCLKWHTDSLYFLRLCHYTPVLSLCCLAVNNVILYVLYPCHKLHVCLHPVTSTVTLPVLTNRIFHP